MLYDMRLVVVDVEDAGLQLEALVARAVAGELIVIAVSGQPVARIVAYDEDSR